MKDTLTKMKNTLQGINCRMYKAEGQAGNVEDKEIENTILWTTKLQKWTQTKKDNLRSLWDNLKCANISIMGVPERERRKQGMGDLFEKNNGWKLL